MYCSRQAVNFDHPYGILTVERDGGGGLIVTFSDGTTAGYVTEELLELRPSREPTAASRSLTGLKLKPAVMISNDE
jgi:hypothetical protein